MAVKRTPRRRTSNKRKSSTPKRRTSRRKSSGKRKRSLNKYFKFKAEYLRTHPAVRNLPVPEQGRVSGRAYRAKYGLASPKRSPRKLSPRKRSPVKRRSPRKNSGRKTTPKRRKTPVRRRTPRTRR